MAAGELLGFAGSTFWGLRKNPTPERSSLAAGTWQRWAQPTGGFMSAWEPFWKGKSVCSGDWTVQPGSEQLGFEYLQRHRLQNLSGQPATLFNHPHPEEPFSYVISCLCLLPLLLSLGTPERSMAPSYLPSLAPWGICTHGWEPLKPPPDGPAPALPARPCSDGSHWWRALRFTLPDITLPASTPHTGTKTRNHLGNFLGQETEEFSLCYENINFVEALDSVSKATSFTRNKWKGKFMASALHGCSWVLIYFHV